MDFVVNGEASETDEEGSDLNLLKKSQILATEVPGEETETESDEELYARTDNSEVFNDVSQFSNSLLQRKLISNNLNILRCAEAFSKNYVATASKTIISCDQLLVRTTQQLQSASQSLKSSNSNTQKLRERVKHLNFIPEVRIPNK